MLARITEVMENGGTKKKHAVLFSCCVGVLYIQVSILALKCCTTVHLFAFTPLAFHSSAAFPLAGTLHTWRFLSLGADLKRNVSVCVQTGRVNTSPLHQYL